MDSNKRLIEGKKMPEVEAPIIVLPADFDESLIKLCKIDDPSCESCQ